MPNPTNLNYFHCYSTNLYAHIKHQYNIPYIAKGIHPETNKTFWVFEKTDQLSQILKSWSNNNPNQKQ